MGKRICILLPNNFGYVQEDFVMSLCEVQGEFYRWQKESGRSDELSILMQGGYCIDAMRNQLVKAALSTDQDYLFFMDTDMIFPSNVIQLMVEDLEDNEESKIEAITGVYTWKKPPFSPHIYIFGEDEQLYPASAFPLNKLFRVDGAGGGCLMAKRELFERVEQPWFLMSSESRKVGDSTMGEDIYFFHKAKPLMLCDPRIQCGHVGKAVHSLDSYLSHNGLEKKDGGIEGSAEDLKKVADQYGKLFKKKVSVEEELE